MNKKNEALEMSIISFEAIMKSGLEDTQAEIMQCKEALKQPSWQGLTDDEIQNILAPIVLLDNADAVTDYEIARAIEQALKEKNNGA